MNPPKLKTKKDKVPLVRRVALCIIATRNYKRLLEPLIKSVKKHFLTQHELSLFIFADSSDYEGWLELSEYDVCWTKIEHLPFPLPTLFRYKYILRRERELSDFDYIFYCDADVRFVGDIGNEMFGNGLTAIQHPTAPFGDMREDFKGWTFEKNPRSLAYIPTEEQKNYWCGAIQGGLSERYLEAMRILNYNIDEDLGQNIIAQYHDETHWNKYLSQNPPDVSLPFWYCFPESEDWPTKQNPWRKDVYVPDEEEIKMLCLDKDLHGGYNIYRGNAKK